MGEGKIDWRINLLSIIVASSDNFPLEFMFSGSLLDGGSGAV